jgi:hypothetical protein
LRLSDSFSFRCAFPLDAPRADTFRGYAAVARVHYFWFGFLPPRSIARSSRFGLYLSVLRRSFVAFNVRLRLPALPFFSICLILLPFRLVFCLLRVPFVLFNGWLRHFRAFAAVAFRLRALSLRAFVRFTFRCAHLRVYFSRCFRFLRVFRAAHPDFALRVPPVHCGTRIFAGLRF